MSLSCNEVYIHSSAVSIIIIIISPVHCLCQGINGSQMTKEASKWYLVYSAFNMSVLGASPYALVMDQWWYVKASLAVKPHRMTSVLVVVWDDR